MSPRNPGLVQSDAPTLLADLIAELTLIGPGVGLLGFNENITPVFIIGSRGVVFDVQEPVFGPAEVFSAGGVGVVAGANIVDTGQLIAGDFDVICGMSAFHAVSAAQKFQLAQRNAGDTANVASWLQSIAEEETDAQVSTTQTPLKFSMAVAEDERFVITSSQTDAALQFGVWLMVRRRPDVT